VIQNVVRADYFIRSPIKAPFVPLVGGVAFIVILSRSKKKRTII